MINTTISRYTTPCSICSADIVPGDRMFCSALETSSNNSSLAWGHGRCYNLSLPPPPACRHWKRLGRCPAKDMNMCAFTHDDIDRGTSITLDKQRWGGNRRFVRNQHKNTCFRIFLMQTYGIDYMNKDNGVVIDVGGGKGELAFELINLSGINECIVFDPRPTNLKLVQQKWRKGLWEPRRTGMFCKWNPACEDGCKDRIPTSPKHIRCFFDYPSFIQQFMNDKDDSLVESTNQQFLQELNRAKRITWTTKGLQEHEDGVNDEEEEEVEDNDDDDDDSNDTKQATSSSSAEITDPTEARDFLQRCHLIIGLHPDQPTGDIVDFALDNNLPWCVVPCCVYSDMFNDRKLQDGTRVKSYDNLIQWLVEKDPDRVKVAKLDLEGKNTVVYTLPEP